MCNEQVRQNHTSVGTKGRQNKTGYQCSFVHWIHKDSFKTWRGWEQGGCWAEGGEIAAAVFRDQSDDSLSGWGPQKWTPMEISMRGAYLGGLLASQARKGGKDAGQAAGELPGWELWGWNGPPGLSQPVGEGQDVPSLKWVTSGQGGQAALCSQVTRKGCTDFMPVALSARRGGPCALHTPRHQGWRTEELRGWGHLGVPSELLEGKSVVQYLWQSRAGGRGQQVQNWVRHVHPLLGSS